MRSKTHAHGGQRAALITGAATRMGKEIALTLAEAGWDVAIHYRRSAREANALAAAIKQMGRRAGLVRAELENGKELARVVPLARKALGHISCLVNNAAVFERDTLRDLTSASWQRHINTNLYAPLVLIRDFAAQCGKGKEGHVINLLDGARGRSISSSFLSYSMSKLGLERATSLLAPELAPHVRINGVALGPTLPGVNDKPDTYKKLRHDTLLKRLPTPREVCGAVMFLLNTPSMTGHVISLSNEFPRKLR